MSERDLPNGTAADEPLTFDEGVAGLEGILDGPDEDPIEKQEVQKTEEPETDEAAAELEDDETDAEETDEDQEESDDDEEAVTLDDETVITLEDGSQASLADLKRDFGQVQKRVADFQRDYTQKTDALAADRQEVEKQTNRILQWANEVKQQRDQVLSLQQKYMPQPPSIEMMDEDPVGYMRQKAAYEEFVNESRQVQHQTQQEKQRAEAEQRQQEAQFLREQQAKMFEVMPELAKSEKYEEFRGELGKVFAPAYGFTMDEIASVRDSRFAPVMRDAILYQKLKADQAKAKVKIANKPPVMQSGKSLSASGKTSKDRKAKADNLRRTGTLEAGISALMDLDL